MKIEIITTPNGMLKETGFGSFEACQSVLKAIVRKGHSVNLSTCCTEEDLHYIVNKQPDLVVLAVKYLSIGNGEKIWLAEYFDQLNINFTGSSREALEFDSNKVHAKLFLSGEGINTARFFTAIPGQFTSKKELPISFPLFLKPMDAANGNGIDDSSLALSFDEYERKLSSLYKSFKQPILVEEYLNGKEFTVAIIKTRSKGFFTSIIEVVPPLSSKGLRILGAKVKQEDTEILKTLENGELMQRVKKLALNVFRLLKIRDFARIDIKTDSLGQCYFMEANLVPGLTSGTSYFPKAFRLSHGFDYDNVIGMLIDGGASRVPLSPAIVMDVVPDQKPAISTFPKTLLDKCSELIN